jgi:F-type H+-transporting ATPase subunit b
MRYLAVLLVGASSLFAASLARAEDNHDHQGHDHQGHDHGAAPQLGGHGDAHAAPGGDHAEGDHGAGHHVPTFDDINWFHGVLGEREGVEPSFLYRPKGMPAPFGAYLLNAAILYFILYRFLSKPIAQGLKTRKSSIQRGIEEASRMRKDAEARLADYEHKLAHI